METLQVDALGSAKLRVTLDSTLFAKYIMYKVSPKILLSNSWSIKKSILMGVGIFVVFRLVTGIYLYWGVKNNWGDLATIPNILLASRQEIDAIINTSGKGISLLLIGLLVPIYEEIIFRGVILDSCQRYLNFNIANIVQALLFAVLHMSWLLLPVFFLFGILTGLMRKKADGLLRESCFICSII